MILTTDYSPVLASFNYPANFELELEGDVGEDKDDGYVFYNFYVGPLEYRFDAEGIGGDWNISFFLIDIKGSKEELVEYFTKAFHRPIAPLEIQQIKMRLLNHSIDDLNLGNAPEVFSNVMAIIKDLIKKYHVECLSFICDSKKKANVYRRLVNKYMRAWFPILDTGNDFKVCRMDT
jgi:hypothetical protein